MRFAFNGLPRDLPLTPEQRRALIDRMGRVKPSGKPPLWVAFVPGAVNLLLMGIWMPALSQMTSPWRYAIVGGAIFVMLPICKLIMDRGMWPYRCRLMALAGYEVCPRCAYPQKVAPSDVRLCSECGGERISVSPLESPADSIRSADVTPQSQPPLP